MAESCIGRSRAQSDCEDAFAACQVQVERVQDECADATLRGEVAATQGSPTRALPGEEIYRYAHMELDGREFVSIAQFFGNELPRSAYEQEGGSIILLPSDEGIQIDHAGGTGGYGSFCMVDGSSVDCEGAAQPNQLRHMGDRFEHSDCDDPTDRCIRTFMTDVFGRCG